MASTHSISPFLHFHNQSFFFNLNRELSLGLELSDASMIRLVANQKVKCRVSIEMSPIEMSSGQMSAAKNKDNWFKKFVRLFSRDKMS